jgi:hypothetical protein
MTTLDRRNSVTFTQARGFLLAMLVATGCAEVTHRPVPYHLYPVAGDSTEAKKANDHEDSVLTGIRYYRSSPYLLVYTDGKGNLVWKIYNLPDQTKLMVATPHQFFSKITTNMTFVNGVLTTAHTETDSTAAVKAVIGAIEKVLPLTKVGDRPAVETIPAPRLYKILVNGSELQLIGGPGNPDIKVSLAPEN